MSSDDKQCKKKCYSIWISMGVLENCHSPYQTNVLIKKVLYAGIVLDCIVTFPLSSKKLEY